MKSNKNLNMSVSRRVNSEYLPKRFVVGVNNDTTNIYLKSSRTSVIKTSVCENNSKTTNDNISREINVDIADRSEGYYRMRKYSFIPEKDYPNLCVGVSRYYPSGPRDTTTTITTIDNGINMSKEEQLKSIFYSFGQDSLVQYYTGFLNIQVLQSLYTYAFYNDIDFDTVVKTLSESMLVSENLLREYLSLVDAFLDNNTIVLASINRTNISTTNVIKPFIKKSSKNFHNVQPFLNHTDKVYDLYEIFESHKYKVFNSSTYLSTYGSFSKNKNVTSEYIASKVSGRRFSEIYKDRLNFLSGFEAVIDNNEFFPDFSTTNNNDDIMKKFIERLSTVVSDKTFNMSTVLKFNNELFVNEKTQKLLMDSHVISRSFLSLHNKSNSMDSILDGSTIEYAKLKVDDEFHTFDPNDVKIVDSKKYIKDEVDSALDGRDTISIISYLTTMNCYSIRVESDKEDIHQIINEEKENIAEKLNIKSEKGLETVYDNVSLFGKAVNDCEEYVSKIKQLPMVKSKKTSVTVKSNFPKNYDSNNPSFRIQVRINSNEREINGFISLLKLMRQSDSYSGVRFMSAGGRIIDKTHVLLTKYKSMTKKQPSFINALLTVDDELFDECFNYHEISNSYMVRNGYSYLGTLSFVVNNRKELNRLKLIGINIDGISFFVNDSEEVYNFLSP